jgi:hypothetical protein
MSRIELRPVRARALRIELRPEAGALRHESERLIFLM